MPHYCPSRAAFAAPRSSVAAESRPACRPASRPASRVSGIRSDIAAWCLRAVGWYRLERLLASIPDSNDDFGIG